MHGHIFLGLRGTGFLESAGAFLENGLGTGPPDLLHAQPQVLWLLPKKCSVTFCMSQAAMSLGFTMLNMSKTQYDDATQNIENFVNTHSPKKGVYVSMGENGQHKLIFRRDCILLVSKEYEIPYELDSTVHHVSLCVDRWDATDKDYNQFLEWINNITKEIKLLRWNYFRQRVNIKIRFERWQGQHETTTHQCIKCGKFIYSHT